MMRHQVILVTAAGAKVEFRCRVFSLTVYVPHHHAGGDWSGVTLARWSSMISSRLVPIRLWIQQRNFRTGGSGAGTSAGRSQVGCLSSLEWF